MSETFSSSLSHVKEGSEGGVSPPVQVDGFFNIVPISFQVENTVFRVPKHGFEIPGTTFEIMFSLPCHNGEGSSNDNPIHLRGIKAEHFRSFLRVVYPFKEQPSVTQFDEWMGVLILSTLWEFTQIRNEAITALSAQIVGCKSTLERIHLGRKYDVADWIRNAYIKLVQKTPFTLEELSEDSEFPLDWQTIAKILYIRDKHFSKRPQGTNGSFYHTNCNRNHGIGSCPYGHPMPVYGVDDSTARNAVNEIFSGQLDQLEALNSVI